MKKIFLVGLILLTVLGIATVSTAYMDQFSGRWTNVNSNTSGITALEINTYGGGLRSMPGGNAILPTAIGVKLMQWLMGRVYPRIRERPMC